MELRKKIRDELIYIFGLGIEVESVWTNGTIIKAIFNYMGIACGFRYNKRTKTTRIRCFSNQKKQLSFRSIRWDEETLDGKVLYELPSGKLIVKELI